MIRLLFILLFTASTVFAVELDTDSNDAVDLTIGGTNATTPAGARTNLEVLSSTETANTYSTINNPVFTGTVTITGVLVLGSDAGEMAVSGGDVDEFSEVIFSEMYEKPTLLSPLAAGNNTTPSEISNFSF